MRLGIAAALLLCATSSSQAGVTVEVTATGTVTFKDFLSPPLSFVQVGETATLTFRTDSEAFLGDGPSSQRAYVLDDTSFTLAFETESFGLDLGHQIPHLVVRNDDAHVDGFFLRGAAGSRVGLFLDAIAVFGKPRLVLDLQTGVSTLGSTSLLDALGTYDEGDFGSASFHLADSFWVPMTIAFRELTITAVGSDRTDEGEAQGGSQPADDTAQAHAAETPTLASEGDLSPGSANALSIKKEKLTQPAGSSAPSPRPKMVTPTGFEPVLPG